MGDMSIRKVRNRLIALKALDNQYRQRTLVEIEKKPGIYFTDLAKKIHIKKELLAYHLGVLHAAGFVEQTLERRGKASKYILTKKGKQALRLFSKNAQN